MAGSIYDWSLTAATNANADSAINWAEFQAPDTVNNSARQMMGRVAEYLDDVAGIRTSTGAANTYAVTTASAPSALGDGLIVAFKAHQANTAACTLAVNSFGAVPLRSLSGTPLGRGEIQAGQIVVAHYLLASNEALIINGAPQLYALYSSLLAGSSFGLKVGDIKISASAAPDAGFVRLTEIVQDLLKADYPELNAWASAQSYPWGSTTTTFGIPPAAGYGLRFAATNATVDTDGTRLAGSIQADQTAAHTHSVTASGTTSTDGTHTHTGTVPQGGGTSSGLSALRGSDVAAATEAVTIASAGAHNHTVTVTGTTGSVGSGTETRGKNVAYHADMLARPALVASGLVGTVGLPYRWDTGVNDADPGSGRLRVNNSTPSLGTILFISDTGQNGEPFASLIATWIASTSTIHGKLTITKIGTPSTFIQYAISGFVIDGGVYDKITVAHVASNGTLLNGDQVSLLFVAAGDAGDTAASYDVVCVNGLNSFISLQSRGKFRVFGPTAAFSIGGWNPGSEGDVIRIYNTTHFAMTIINEEASTAFVSRIKTLTGANVTLRAGSSYASFQYDATDARWILTGTN